MSETTTPSISDTLVSSSTSKRNNNRRNKKKRSQQNDQSVKFQGETADFGAVFVLGDETSEGKPSSFKKAVVATEVYVAATYASSAKVLGSLFDDEPSLPTLAPPPEPVGEDAENELRRMMYMEHYKRHLTKSEQLTNTLHSLFTIIWGQCSPGIQSRIRSSGFNSSSRKRKVTVPGFSRKLGKSCSFSVMVATDSEPCWKGR